MIRFKTTALVAVSGEGDVVVTVKIPAEHLADFAVGDHVKVTLETLAGKLKTFCALRRRCDDGKRT